MNEDAVLKLLAIFVVVAGAWLVGRMRWLGDAPSLEGAGVHDPARVLANSAFYIFIPALLCRTTARLDMRLLRTLARQVHASIARAIQPFHALVDGDVLFAVSTNEVEEPLAESVGLGVVASELAWDAVLAAVRS